MRERDDETGSFGAEAMPGGLAEFNDAMRARRIALHQGAPAPARAPLFGLIALAAHWMRRHRERK